MVFDDRGRPTEEASDLERELDPAPGHRQIAERSPGAAMDMPGEQPTAWTGPLSGSEANHQGEALFSQDHLLQQQIGNRREQRCKAHTNILWQTRAANLCAA